MEEAMTGIRGVGRTSRRLVISYVLDWITIIAIAAVGGGFDFVSPNRRPFDLSDPDISFPYVEKPKVSVGVLVVVGLVAPALIILAIILLFIPGPTARSSTTRGGKWRMKLWELNTGWSGLAMGLAWTFVVTNGMKNLFGRPRPDLLSRCNPDVEQAKKFATGGVNPDFLDKVVLVTWEICRGTAADLEDGFRSFPSGHCSFSFAGMTYLTLYLCAKFAISVPFLSPRVYTQDESGSGAYLAAVADKSPILPTTNGDSTAHHSSTGTSALPLLRNQAAGPPVYLQVLAFFPIGTAIYIASTRFSDFRHHAFDIIFGSLIGIIGAWIAFRWYHLPVRRGAGWAWGARTKERAFGIGVGLESYAGSSKNDEVSDHVSRETHGPENA